MELSRPRRVIINFTKKCALNCEWCYVDFDKSRIDIDTLIRVIDRVHELGFESITFGGGDPFQVRHLSLAIIQAKTLGLNVHVDTHGISLLESDKNISLINNYVDWLGLPLDGSTKETHDLMRGKKGHFDLVMQKLSWLKETSTRIKINTIVTQVNKHEISSLASLIKMIGPHRWSVYQYWPVGVAARASLSHNIQGAEFDAIVDHLDMFSLGKTVVEFNNSESRRNTYPILNHEGKVTVHNEYPNNSYNYIGSIFDDNVANQITTTSFGERYQAVSRYKAIG